MKHISVILILFSLNIHAFAQNSALSNVDSLKLLVVTGGPTLKYHINLVPTSFYGLFQGYDNLFWDHATYDEAAFQVADLDNYDVILLYNRSDTLSQKSKDRFKRYLESGKGLVVLHHALGSYNNWEWWWKEVVGGKYQMKTTLEFRKSDYKQGEQLSMTSVRKHPISDAIGNFSFEDETYRKLWVSKEVQVLYKTDNGTSDGPTVWIGPYKKSKVVVIQPGHAMSAHTNENYKKLIYQSLWWVGS